VRALDDGALRTIHPTRLVHRSFIRLRHRIPDPRLVTPTSSCAWLQLAARLITMVIETLLIKTQVIETLVIFIEG
jgi:hypothetical protein